MSQASSISADFSALGLAVLQRDWLSANQVVFPACNDAPASVIDTGHARHADMTLALIDQVLGTVPLGQILNTHLHSDHCGGNAALQARYPGVRTAVPRACLEAVQRWDVARLSHDEVGQYCPRFAADHGLRPGSVVKLGGAGWQVLGCPGHDPDAVMLFEPDTRTLVAGDALWEDRLAIIFPELVGEDGFGPTLATLALIEHLAPRWVIPGHGGPFDDVGAALASSRTRLKGFMKSPERHVQHAARALLMFHMMEERQVPHSQVLAWLQATPLFRRMAEASGAHTDGAMASWADRLLKGLLDSGHLQQEHAVIRLS